MSHIKYGENLHKEYPKTCDPKDFWGQICRTVNGKPVGREQIEMIVTQIGQRLDLNPKDNLLDLGCGNGALSALLIDRINLLLGVDFSEYLISVAKENFENKKLHFVLDDAEKFCSEYNAPQSFNKVLSYGAFSYFQDEVAEKMLIDLNVRFTNVTHIFLGNLPDRSRADNFYSNLELKEKYIDDPNSAIGAWRTINDFEKFAARCGWLSEFYNMPDNFYASHYRYDVLLIRNS